MTEAAPPGPEPGTRRSGPRWWTRLGVNGSGPLAWPRWFADDQARDVVLAVLVGVAAFSEVYYSTLSPWGWREDPVTVDGVVLLLCGIVALTLLRPYPVPAAVILALSLNLSYTVSISADTAAPWMAYLVGIFRLAAGGQRAAAVTGTALAFGLFVVSETMLVVLYGSTSGWAPSALGWPLALLAFGEIARRRREYLEEVERRAIAAEQTREAVARRRATEERLRIARELHDVLAHQISLINVQAAAAAHRRDDPERAYDALETIKQASKDTLRELRATLGVLRQVDAADTDDGPGVAPAPTLDRVAELVERTRAAGLPVELVVEGERRPLTAPVDVAGYRIAQEALTNALRHASPTTATVRVRYHAGRVDIEVSDTGRGADPADTNSPEGPNATSPGSGLRGMRERALALGGTLSAGPRAGGGFEVRATLPTRSC